MGFFMSFHERLKQKMEEKGVTPAALARAASVSPVAAGKWVHGESEPKAAKLKLIADFLGVTDDWLLTGKGSPSKLDNNIDLSEKIPLEGRPIPVISWVAAGSLSSIETVLKDTEIKVCMIIIHILNSLFKCICKTNCEPDTVLTTDRVEKVCTHYSSLMKLWLAHNLITTESKNT